MEERNSNNCRSLTGLEERRCPPVPPDTVTKTITPCATTGIEPPDTPQPNPESRPDHEIQFTNDTGIDNSLSIAQTVAKSDQEIEGTNNGDVNKDIENVSGVAPLQAKSDKEIVLNSTDKAKVAEHESADIVANGNTSFVEPTPLSNDEIDNSENVERPETNDYVEYSTDNVNNTKTNACLEEPLSTVETDNSENVEADGNVDHQIIIYTETIEEYNAILASRDCHELIKHYVDENSVIVEGTSNQELIEYHTENANEKSIIVDSTSNNADVEFCIENAADKSLVVQSIPNQEDVQYYTQLADNNSVIVESTSNQEGVEYYTQNAEDNSVVVESIVNDVKYYADENDKSVIVESIANHEEVECYTEHVDEIDNNIIVEIPDNCAEHVTISSGNADEKDNNSVIVEYGDSCERVTGNADKNENSVVIEYLDTPGCVGKYTGNTDDQKDKSVIVEYIDDRQRITNSNRNVGEHENSVIVESIANHEQVEYYTESIGETIDIEKDNSVIVEYTEQQGEYVTNSTDRKDNAVIVEYTGHQEHVTSYAGNPVYQKDKPVIVDTPGCVTNYTGNPVYQNDKSVIVEYTGHQEHVANYTGNPDVQKDKPVIVEYTEQQEYVTYYEDESIENNEYNTLNLNTLAQVSSTLDPYEPFTVHESQESYESTLNGNENNRSVAYHPNLTEIDKASAYPNLTEIDKTSIAIDQLSVQNRSREIFQDTLNDNGPAYRKNRPSCESDELKEIAEQKTADEHFLESVENSSSTYDRASDCNRFNEGFSGSGRSWRISRLDQNYVGAGIHDNVGLGGEPDPCDFNTNIFEEVIIHSSHLDTDFEDKENQEYYIATRIDLYEEKIGELDIAEEMEIDCGADVCAMEEVVVESSEDQTFCGGYGHSGDGRKALGPHVATGNVKTTGNVKMAGNVKTATVNVKTTQNIKTATVNVKTTGNVYNVTTDPTQSWNISKNVTKPSSSNIQTQGSGVTQSSGVNQRNIKGGVVDSKSVTTGNEGAKMSPPVVMFKWGGKDSRRFRCQICDMSYHTGEQLKMHMLKHTVQTSTTPESNSSNQKITEKPYLCTICLKSFAHPKGLAIHDRTHSGVPKQRCKFCKLGFRNKANLDQHVATHTNLLRCRYCEREFAFMSKYKNHLLTHRVKDSHRDIDGHRDIDAVESLSHKCEVCERRFTRKDILKRHSRTHLGEEGRTHKCVECGKSYSHLFVLKRHVRSMHSDEPDGKTCDICGKFIRFKENYGRHLLIHSDMRGFTCTECGSSFTQKQHLQDHMNTHSDELKFTCRHCPLAFKHRRSLNRHISSHLSPQSTGSSGSGSRLGLKPINQPESATDPIQCETCSNSFPNKFLFKMHLKTDHESVYRCLICNQFLAQDKLFKHIDSHENVAGLTNGKAAYKELANKRIGTDDLSHTPCEIEIESSTIENIEIDHSGVGFSQDKIGTEATNHGPYEIHIVMDNSSMIENTEIDNFTMGMTKTGTGTSTTGMTNIDTGTSTLGVTKTSTGDSTRGMTKIGNPTIGMTKFDTGTSTRGMTKIDHSTIGVTKIGNSTTVVTQIDSSSMDFSEGNLPAGYSFIDIVQTGETGLNLQRGDNSEYTIVEAVETGINLPGGHNSSQYAIVQTGESDINIPGDGSEYTIVQTGESDINIPGDGSEYTVVQYVKIENIGDQVEIGTEGSSSTVEIQTDGVQEDPGIGRQGGVEIGTDISSSTVDIQTGVVWEDPGIDRQSGVEIGTESSAIEIDTNRQYHEILVDSKRNKAVTLKSELDSFGLSTVAMQTEPYTVAMPTDAESIDQHPMAGVSTRNPIRFTGNTRTNVDPVEMEIDRSGATKFNEHSNRKMQFSNSTPPTYEGFASENETAGSQSIARQPNDYILYTQNVDANRGTRITQSTPIETTSNVETAMNVKTTSNEITSNVETSMNVEIISNIPNEDNNLPVMLEQQQSLQQSSAEQTFVLSLPEGSVEIDQNEEIFVAADNDEINRTLLLQTLIDYAERMKDSPSNT